MQSWSRNSGNYRQRNSLEIPPAVYYAKATNLSSVDFVVGNIVLLINFHSCPESLCAEGRSNSRSGKGSIYPQQFGGCSFGIFSEKNDLKNDWGLRYAALAFHCRIYY